VRLSILERGHPPFNRMALRLMRVIGGDPDDVVKTMLYRPAFFGRAWSALVRSVMRAPSPWTAGEREVFGACVSRLNATPFCEAIHTRTASLALETTVDDRVLDDPGGSGLGPRVAATLAFLRTAATGEATPDDVATLRASGVTDRELLDAVEVCFVFNLVNRLANALGYSSPDDESCRRSAVMLHKMGYKMPRMLLR
jgi:uncharacterized peroxidase-related enzyme